jgi:hypothetical protein
METTTMLSRFTPPALIRGPQGDRTVQLGRRTPAKRRRADRTRARFQLEGLEARCLLSGISAVAGFLTPTHGTGHPTWGITTGPDGNVWFTENVFSQIGMINPTTDEKCRCRRPEGGQHIQRPGSAALVG